MATENRNPNAKESKVVPLHQAPKKKTTLFYILLAVAVIALSFYQVFKINYSPIKTEIAIQKTIYDTVSCDSFIVRDETPIQTNIEGTLVPLVVDGRRVARGDAVAVVFKSEDAAKSYTRMQELQEKIAYFESLKNKVGNHTSDMESMDERIYDAVGNMVKAVSYGKTDFMPLSEHALCDAITSRQLAMGDVIDPTEKITALKAELSELKANASGGYETIYAPNPGYYIGHVDGYEEALDYAYAPKANQSQIESLFTYTPKSPKECKGYMGKLVDGFNWYLYCIIPAESAGDLSVGNTIEVNFPLSNAEPVDAQIVSLQNIGDNKATLILRSNLMNSQYAGLRHEEVNLVLNTYDGFQINNRAVREVDGEKGVYIVSGNIIEFKKVNLVYSDENYSLCETPKDENGNPKKGYVELYDEIIIEGTDLYDGKVLG